MIKLFTFFIAIAIINAGSYDTSECETLYNQAQHSLSEYKPVYKHYHVSRCMDYQNQGRKIVLNGEYSNRICYVIVINGKFQINDKDPMDCFKYFKLELPKAKARANFLL